MRPEKSSPTTQAPPAFERVYEAHKSAIPFHDSLAQVKALCGPVGSGKSLAAIMEFIFLCREATVPIRGVVLRESYRQLHDSTIKTWMEWLAPVTNYRRGEEVLELTIPGFDGQWRTHELHCRHARRVEEASNFLSTEYAYIWLEEVVPAFQVGTGVVGAGLQEGIFQVALMRQRQAHAHRLHIVLTFNPPNKFHWTYKTFFAKSPAELDRLGFVLYRQPAKENVKHLPAKYYERLEEQLPPGMVERFVMGEPVTLFPGDRVYPECVEATHFANLDPIKGVPLICFYDFGRTPCVLFNQITPTGQLRTLREIQMWGCSTERLAEEMTRQMHEFFNGLKYGRGWGDPSGGDARGETDDRTSFQVLSSRGYSVLPGAMTFRARSEAVKQRFRRNDDAGKPAALIDLEACPMLHDGLLGGYRYPVTTDGKIGRTPIKDQYSHSCNAYEYGCSGEFSIFTGEAKQQAAPKPFNPLERVADPFSGSGWMSN